MTLQSESMIETHELEKVGKLSILRVLDFEALAKEYPEAIPTEILRDAGDYTVEFAGKGRNVEPVRVKVASVDAARAFVQGFAACANALKRKPRNPNGAGNSRLARMNHSDLVKLAASKKPACKVEISKAGADKPSKADLIAAISAYEKKHPPK